MESNKSSGVYPATKHLILLFILAISIRGIAAFLFHLLISPLSLETLLDPYETYQDYALLYSLWSKTIWSGEWIPYSWGNANPLLDYYVYTPVFLYLLAPFSLPPLEYAFLPILLSDAATIIPVYLIVTHLYGQRAGLHAGIIFALSPLNVFYVGTLWLNPGPSTFFFMVCLYITIVKEQHKPAAFFAALAVMTKQSMIFFVIPLYLFLLAKFGRRIGKSLGIFTGTCLALSLPYLVINPEGYLAHLNVSGTPSLSLEIDLPFLTHPVRFVHTLFYLGLRGLPLEVFVISYNSYLCLIFSLLGVSAWIWKAGRRQMNWETLLHLIFLFSLGTHLFLPRGIYKYYLAALTPLAITHLYRKRNATTTTIGQTPRESLYLLGFLTSSILIIVVPRLTYHILIALTFTQLIYDFSRTTSHSQ